MLVSTIFATLAMEFAKMLLSKTAGGKYAKKAQGPDLRADSLDLATRRLAGAKNNTLRADSLSIHKKRINQQHQQEEQGVGREQLQGGDPWAEAGKDLEAIAAEVVAEASHAATDGEECDLSQHVEQARQGASDVDDGPPAASLAAESGGQQPGDSTRGRLACPSGGGGAVIDGEPSVPVSSPAARADPRSSTGGAAADDDETRRPMMTSASQADVTAATVGSSGDAGDLDHGVGGAGNQAGSAGGVPGVSSRLGLTEDRDGGSEGSEILPPCHTERIDSILLAKSRGVPPSKTAAVVAAGGRGRPSNLGGASSRVARGTEAANLAKGPGRKSHDAETAEGVGEVGEAGGAGRATSPLSGGIRSLFRSVTAGTPTSAAPPASSFAAAAATAAPASPPAAAFPGAQAGGGITGARGLSRAVSSGSADRKRHSEDDSGAKNWAEQLLSKISSLVAPNNASSGGTPTGARGGHKSGPLHRYVPPGPGEFFHRISYHEYGRYMCVEMCGVCLRPQRSQSQISI